MKYRSLLALVLTTLMFVGCDKDDDNSTDPVPTDGLSPEIEVYEPSLVHNNLVMLIENGGYFAHLVDKKGEKHFTWEFEKKLGNDVEMLDDGSLLAMFKVENPTFSFGGYGGLIQIINPDLSVEWEYEYASGFKLAHHDVEMLPNGNVLFLVWDKIPMGQAGSLGINANYDVFIETLVEVNPSTDEIVWTWRSADHLIQDFDLDAQNYGAINEHPEKININYNLQEDGDLMHANGIDYDANNDVIYMSVNFFNEIWVIDHSTSITESASSNGGNYNKGGDLLYRFGNPNAYNNAEGEQLFDRNHFPNLIEGDKPGIGNLLIYVNGNSSSQSSVYELDMPEAFDLQVNVNNEPPVVWSFTDTDLFFGKLSGAIRLSNGNTLICEGDYGYWEVTPAGEVCWKYNGTAGTYWRGYDYDAGSTGLKALGVDY